MQIKLYSTSTCPYCIMARRYLDEKSIQYEYIDVSKNREAAKEMIDKSGQRGVPVIEIDGNIIVGFDKNKIDGLLKQK